MTRTRVMSPGKEGGMRILCKAPQTIHPKPCSCFAGIGAGYPGGVQSQSSVKASQAMLSQATLSQATLSQATLSQATLSQATLSQATLSQAKLSQATLSQTKVFQVSTGQKIPPNSGSCHCSGEPKRTGYRARAKPSAGLSPLLTNATQAVDWSVPKRRPPCGAGAEGAVFTAAYALSSPLPSAMGSGRTWPLVPP